MADQESIRKALEKKKFEEAVSGFGKPVTGARSLSEALAGIAFNKRVAEERERRRNQAFTQATGVDPDAPGIPQTFEQAVALANAKNEERFEQGLTLFDEQAANAASFGQTRKEQIRRQDIGQEGQDIQSLIDRGLLNSSGFEDLQRARQEDTRFQNLALDESVLRERNAILGDRIGFIERRTDAAPDPALFLQAQTAASSAPGGGGGGGGGGGSGGGGISFSTLSGRPITQLGGGASNRNPASAPIGGGTLVRRNPGADGGSQTPRSSGRGTATSAKEAFAVRGVNMTGLSNSQIDQALRSVGIVISSVNQIAGLSDQAIANINNAIQATKQSASDFNRGANR